jgi:hypothetical protein
MDGLHFQLESGIIGTIIFLNRKDIFLEKMFKVDFQKMLF